MKCQSFVGDRTRSYLMMCRDSFICDMKWHSNPRATESVYVCVRVRERKRDMTVSNRTQSSAMHERPIYTYKTNIKHKKQTYKHAKENTPACDGRNTVLRSPTEKRDIFAWKETDLLEKRHLCMTRNLYAWKEIYMREKRLLFSSSSPFLPSSRSWQTWLRIWFLFLVFPPRIFLFILNLRFDATFVKTPFLMYFWVLILRVRARHSLAYFNRNDSSIWIDWCFWFFFSFLIFLWGSVKTTYLIDRTPFFFWKSGFGQDARVFDPDALAS